MTSCLPGGDSGLFSRHPLLFRQLIHPNCRGPEDRVGVKRRKIFVLHLKHGVEERDCNFEEIHGGDFCDELVGVLGSFALMGPGACSRHQGRLLRANCWHCEPVGRIWVQVRTMRSSSKNEKGPPKRAFQVSTSILSIYGKWSAKNFAAIFF